MSHYAATNGVPGAYEILHVKSGRRYVGSTGDLYQRECSHIALLRRGTHFNRELQAAYDEDPEIYFTAVPCHDREEAFGLEQAVVDRDGDELFNRGVVDVRNPAKGLVPTVEHRRKIGDANRGRYVGIPLSEDHRSKIGEALRGKPLSEETRRKLSVAHMGQLPSNTRGVVIGGVGYASATEASKALGVKPATIYQRCHSLSEQFKAWTFNK
jgi:NUMOD3 motif